MSDKVLAEEIRWMSEIRKKRPEYDRAINATCVRFGADSIHDLARNHTEAFDQLYNGLFSAEDEVGDGEPDAPNWS